ncbi:hypothetical protein K0M31_001565 [Melipona bicolor]|uniref:Uncharacterized protein n=1 Tax=Melipona bicolor TaxID=60889 RepID=A0AA40GFU7_9HYME|nr:hypothetical protein K0M31_001565 [Melipona bicolor]
MTDVQVNSNSNETTANKLQQNTDVTQRTDDGKIGPAKDPYRVSIRKLASVNEITMFHGCIIAELTEGSSSMINLEP